MEYGLVGCGNVNGRERAVLHIHRFDSSGFVEPFDFRETGILVVRKCCTCAPKHRYHICVHIFLQILHMIPLAGLGITISAPMPCQQSAHPNKPATPSSTPPPKKKTTPRRGAYTHKSANVISPLILALSSNSISKFNSNRNFNPSCFLISSLCPPPPSFFSPVP